MVTNAKKKATEATANEYDEATLAYVARIMAMPPAERARYVAQCGSWIIEALSEANKRQAALWEIVQSLDEAADDDCDDLDCQVHNIYEVFWCFGDYALSGEGMMNSGYHRSPDAFRLDPDRLSELRRRFAGAGVKRVEVRPSERTEGAPAPQDADVQALLRRIGDAAARLADTDYAAALRFAEDLERQVAQLPVKASAA